MPNKKKKENRKKNVRVTTIDIQGTSLPLQNLPVSSAPMNSEVQTSHSNNPMSLQDESSLAQIIASNRNPNVKDIIDTIKHDLNVACDDPTAFINAQLEAAGFQIGEKGNWVRNTTTTVKNSVMEFSPKKSEESSSLPNTNTSNEKGNANVNVSTAAAATTAASSDTFKNEKNSSEKTESFTSKSSMIHNTMICHPTNSSYSHYNPDLDRNDDDKDDHDHDDDDHVVGVCLHCGMSPPLSSSLVDLQTNLDQVIPCSTNTNATHDATDKTDKNEENDNFETAPGIQVSCDECHSFICTACHWCHEYQANHEIRVCDRCDAFYCKGCDEMDQCEDCGEVVCDGCGALCSCKFCGCGLCGDCATACGR